MTLSIISKSAKAPDHAPVYGNLVHANNLAFAMRTSSELNAFDLSDDEHTILNVGDNITYSERGLSTVGKSFLKVPDFTFLDHESYTIQAVVAVDEIDTNVTNAANIAITGDFKGGNVSTTLTFNSSASKIRLAGYFGGYSEASGGKYAGVSLDLPSSCFVDLGNNKYKILPVYLALSLNVDGASSSTNVYIKSISSDRVGGADFDAGTYTFKFDVATKKANQPSPNPLCVGGLDDGFTSLNSAKRDIKEVRIDTQHLTAAQIEEQYQATKKWLLAEGKIDISHWR